MTFREWWEMFWGNAVKVEADINGNLVKGILLKPSKYIKDDGILYLHGGQFDIEVQNISRFTDAITYRAAGYPVLCLKFPEEDEGGQTDPNRDIAEIYSAPVLFRKFYNVNRIHIITVSRGGYSGLFAYQYYSALFGKMVSFCPPIHTENADWLKTQNDWAIKFLTKKLPSPMVLAEQGQYAQLKDRMMMIGGKVDTTCPPALHSEKFSKIVGCSWHTISGYGHNVAQSGEARGYALQFIGG